MKEISEWRRFQKRLVVDRALVPLKGCMFLYYGAWSLYLPYLTLQMVQVGLNMEEIAIIYAVLPFASCIAPPIAGLVADKFNRYKVLLIGSVALAGVFHSLLLQVDARMVIESNLVENDSMGVLVCNRTGSFIHLQSEMICNRTKGVLVANSVWTPANCSARCQHAKMNVCTKQSTCWPVALNSSGSVDLDLVLEGVRLDGECVSRIDRVEMGNRYPVSQMLCTCQIECPVWLEFGDEMVSIRSNWSRVGESERAKHNWGFGLYFVLRILASMSLSTSLSMLDATAICMVKKRQADLGKQRIFGVIGQAIMAMIAGILLDWFTSIKGYQDYGVVFYMADVLFVIVIALVTRLDVAVEKVEGNWAANVKKLLALMDVNVFLLMMLLLGTCWGFLESYLFVYLTEMDASSYLLGMTVTLGCVIGLPLLYVSDALVARIGEINVIIVAFLVYCVRFIGYSFIRNPWYCLPLEALEAVTVHLMAIASSIYCSAAAPSGTLATLNGAVGSFHYSFGRGVGSFVGGILIANFGTRTTFQIFGVWSGIVGLAYLILHRSYLIQLERLRTRRKSEHIAAVLASGGCLDEEPEEMIIPPDNLMGRRISCF